jgi:hypothetical protein
MAFELITTSKISVFLVDHYYKNQNVKKNEKNVESQMLSFILVGFRRSDFCSSDLLPLNLTDHKKTKLSFFYSANVFIPAIHGEIPLQRNDDFFSWYFIMYYWDTVPGYSTVDAA